MKELLKSFFEELGLVSLAKGISEAGHRFQIKIYCKLFEIEICKPISIVTKQRVEEMKKLYNQKVKEINESKRID